MRGTLLLLISLLIGSTIAMAQDSTAATAKKKKSCSCAFSSIVNVGILEGENDAEFQLQTVQGMRVGKWFAGLGVGLDYYHIRSIPVFIDLRRDFFNRKNAPFIYADGGIHFPWARDIDKPSYEKAEFENGFFYDVGLGYRVGNRKRGFLLSAGYSFKYLKESRIRQMCTYVGCTDEPAEWYRYKLNRLSLKMGLQL